MTSAVESPYGLSKDFQWSPDYQCVLEQIASSDIVEPSTEWGKLRDMIKYKIEQNVALFLTEAQGIWLGEPPQPATGIPDNTGNLRLPPFPPRGRNELNPHEAPRVHMDPDEANDTKNLIFRQLHEFDDNPPFTIQRVCELCVSPMQHYKFIGKYLRAVEKSILVTSTWDAFPPEPPPRNGFSMATVSIGPLTQSVPTTPMFSPIPFLHDDARRSQSRSPPPSPLTLAAMEVTSSIEPFNGTVPQRAIGLVDELDDPSPGHMSDHPTAISSVTTVESRPFLETLGSRFVKGSEDQTAMESEREMIVDDADDKENEG
ncbi:hypothetical protein PAXRUDRAFT_33584 [Paxillus rubicundulus Ve08.2h10]|uniref:PPP4R2-domain-containing protein n=1 Tax=Paxillus rubicundulus Ve08.2h10 TaxID=930991 RepID=A0A0D0DWJ7_9AGAM|nr:hypothetical protein PAXRUDRAFT_33584 [Paxillus rubicundulus Ve08.2h10]